MDNPYHYFTLLLFNEDDVLVAAVLHDDYTGYYDLEKGVVGSNLSDVNEAVTRDEFYEQLTGYLDQMLGSYDVVHNNNREATESLLNALGIVGYTPKKLEELSTQDWLYSVPQSNPLQYVQEQSAYWYKAMGDIYAAPEYDEEDV